MERHIHYQRQLNYTKESDEEVIASGYADAVAYVRPFIANPDLVERFDRDLPLSDVDQFTLYGGDAKGYTDYPFASNHEDRLGTGFTMMNIDRASSYGTFIIPPS